MRLVVKEMLFVFAAPVKLFELVFLELGHVVARILVGPAAALAGLEPVPAALVPRQTQDLHISYEDYLLSHYEHVVGHYQPCYQVNHIMGPNKSQHYPLIHHYEHGDV